tara:strand:+ start:439 stop:1215 length:777 start_codon:yes stop_codon:yes gene_type:complete
MPNFPKNNNFSLKSPLSKIESKANLTNAEKAANLNKHAAKHHNDPNFRSTQVKYNQAALNDANQPSAKKSPAPAKIKNISRQEDQPNVKKKRTFKEAYKKRDMKTYGNLSQEEYTKEAKRQTANKKATTVAPKEIGIAGKMSKGKEGSYDAPKSQMKGSVTGPKTKGGDATKKSTPKITQETKLPVTKDSKKTQSVKDARSKRKEARKAVKTARKTSGRGSDEVKAAKKARKTAKANVKTAKKNRKATRKQSKEFAKN